MAATSNPLSGSSNLLMMVSLTIVLGMLLLPLPAFIIDSLVSFNIVLSVIVLLVTLYLQEPLQFSIFPAFLLLSTIFRLALGILITRAILTGASGGNIVTSLGNLVIGGNYIVGIVIFIVLVIIQFVVVTSGAQRVAEVAARFTLDAMPGKQMSIDADLNAGFITEEVARERRKAIAQEADFYGAMDGAAKFIRGDAVASIIIIVVNIIGGLVIGMIQLNFPFLRALQIFTLLTVGAGVVLQVPSLMISIATGVVVTRVQSEDNLGKKMAQQLSTRPEAIGSGGVVAIGLSLIPGIPMLPFLILGSAALAWYFMVANKPVDKQATKPTEQSTDPAASPSTGGSADTILPNLKFDTVRFEIGYGLISLVDPKQGGELLNGITGVRKQCATELGIVIPAIRVRDNMTLKPNAYSIEINGVEAASGEIMMGRLMAIQPPGGAAKLSGFDTKDPTFGLPAVWIASRDRNTALEAGYTVVDATAVITTHLTEILKSHSSELLGRQEVQIMIDKLKDNYPAVVNELIPNLMTIGEIQAVLRNLLVERIPLTNLVTILEVLADHAKLTKDPDLLTSRVRAALFKQITRQFKGVDGAIQCVTLDPRLEQQLIDSIEITDQGAFTKLSPGIIQQVFASVGSEIKKVANTGQTPIIVTSTQLRSHFKRLIDRVIPNVVCLSFNEIDPTTDIHSMGVVAIHDN